MAYDHELTLIKQTYTEDELGNQIPIEVRNSILCEELSVTRSEFYNAAAQNLRPSKVLKVHRFEYDDESLLEYEDGFKYRIIRSYGVNTEELELTCEKVAADG